VQCVSLVQCAKFTCSNCIEKATHGAAIQVDIALAAALAAFFKRCHMLLRHLT